MSILSTIKNIQPTFYIDKQSYTVKTTDGLEEEKEYYTVRAVGEFSGKLYSGLATCRSEDKEFFSPRVGKRIAITRMRLAILKEAREKAYKEYKIK